MRWIPFRWTVFRVMLATATLAIPLSIVANAARQRAEEHAGRCLRIADNHARLAANYRSSAKADPAALRIAAWHEFLNRRFEQAAERPSAPFPATSPWPPLDWQPPGEVAVGK